MLSYAPHLGHGQKAVNGTELFQIECTYAKLKKAGTNPIQARVVEK
jgi:hypothetical protein